jgi:beta-glucosidase
MFAWRAVEQRVRSCAVTAETDLPPGFVWGVATSAYQIEGAVDADGRGPSIWDTFCRQPGRVANGETGDVACDHYHRWRGDLDLLTDLGVDAYRLSVAWPRVQPDGSGRPEGRGLDFYRRLLDGLRQRGIVPWVTLYHWDLPQALEDRGGWRVRDTALRFGEYAEIVANALAEFAPRWITLNEPYCSSITGYAEGRHAPGAHEGHGALAAAHHLLLGHGLAVPALRTARPELPVGVTLNMSPAVPATDAPTDHPAAARQDLLVNRLFTDPLLAGVYPAEAEQVWGELSDFSFVRDGDLATIAAPLDFLGINYYYRIHVRDATLPDGGPARSAYQIGVESVTPDGARRTGLGWPIEPEGLHATLTGLRSRYPGLPPIYITENGCAYPDEVGPDGSVDDRERIAFIEAHLDATARAIADGVDVRGYFHWSLLDNFEWARGYAPRFGLVHVDYATQVRTPKASFGWLRDRITR